MSLLSTLTALVALDHLPRTGWLLRRVPAPESVAGHILGTAQVALALAPRVEPGLDLGKVLSIALMHDAPEAWSGDLPRPGARHLPAGAKAAMEDAIARTELEPMGSWCLAAQAEYQAGESREARFVRLCDRLQLGVRLVAYLETGQRGLDDFVQGLLELDASEFPPAESLANELRARLRELIGP